MRGVFDKSRYVNISGCWYPRDYKWISLPCYHMSPHGGIFNKLPDFYQDYENELKKARERFRRTREKEEQDRWKEYSRRFSQGFFGFNEEPEDEEKDKNYPYSVFGLNRSASDDDVKKAYRKSVLKAHPDKGGSNELFRKVREAWNYFKNYLS